MSPDPLPSSEEQFSALFQKIEQHVIDNCPNPDRIGCFTSDELKALVHHPEQFNLQDQKYIHLFRCAECTREIKTFREEYERERAAKSVAASQSTAKLPRISPRFGIAETTAIAFASICLGALIAWQLLTPKGPGPASQPSVESHAAQILDLTSLSTTRGANNTAQLVIFRDANTFVIELPALSPVGTYHVSIVGDTEDELAAADGIAKVVDGKTELSVSLAVKSIPPGTYRLALRSQQDSAPYYYPAVIR